MNLPEAAERLAALMLEAAGGGWNLLAHQWVEERFSPWIVVGVPEVVDSFLTVGRPEWHFVVEVGVDPAEDVNAVSSFLLAIDGHDPRSLVAGIIAAASDATWGTFRLDQITTRAEVFGQSEHLVARIPVHVVPSEV